MHGPLPKLKFKYFSMYNISFSFLSLILIFSFKVFLHFTTIHWFCDALSVAIWPWNLIFVKWTFNHVNIISKNCQSLCKILLYYFHLQCMTQLTINSKKCTCTLIHLQSLQHFFKVIHVSTLQHCELNIGFRTIFSFICIVVLLVEEIFMCSSFWQSFYKSSSFTFANVRLMGFASTFISCKWCIMVGTHIWSTFLHDEGMVNFDLVTHVWLGNWKSFHSMY